MAGFGDADTIHGRSGDDTLDGDVGSANLGSDTLFGESGRDNLEGQSGVNEYFGGSGGDTIDAEFPATFGGADEERSHGGPGNDEIFANDDLVDLIDCGSGTDTIHLDNGLPIGTASDAIANDCENTGP